MRSPNFYPQISSDEAVLQLPCQGDVSRGQGRASIPNAECAAVAGDALPSPNKKSGGRVLEGREMEKGILHMKFWECSLVTHKRN